MIKDKNLIKIRVESLDWLRGLAALSIMFYHIYSWRIVPLNADSFLGRLGIYAVSIFFLLSGLSMAIVYNNFIKDIKTSFAFFVRRIFRIWSLLWVVTTFNFIIELGSGHTLKQFIEYIENITTLFGFIKPEAYIATGAWSIGNEMVYYAMTPIIIMAYNTKKLYGNILFGTSLIIGYLFAFNILNPDIILTEQWSTYINPFNNLFFYIGGIAIYYNLKNIDFNKYINNSVLLIALGLFCFIPLNGNQIIITTLVWRIVFSLLCFVIVIGFYKLKLDIPEFIGRPFKLFGIDTYGVYLLHPIFYRIITYIFNKINISTSGINMGILTIMSVSVITTLFAWISYYKFESKFMKYGKKIFLFRERKEETIQTY